MHKNRVIIILGIFIIFIAGSGFVPETKKLLIEAFSAIIVILAFLIEKKGIFSLEWRKRNPVTPVASTYIEHNGTVVSTTPVAPAAQTSEPTIDLEKTSV